MNSKGKLFAAMLIVIVVGVGGYYVGSQYLPLNKPEKNTWTFTDSRNRTVEVPIHPEKIVSMAPSITEILFKIGVQDRLVGVTDYCNYPEEAKNITSIGGFSTPDIENLTALNPDLIIASTWNEKSVQALENANLTIVIIEANSIVEIMKSIKTIGKLTDAEAKANEVANSLWNRIWAVSNKTSQLQEDEKLKVYFEIWESPMTVGGDSFINDLINFAGGINIFGNINQTYPIVSNEDIINLNPDVIFITEHSSVFYSQAICNRTGYDTISACQNNRVYSVNDDVYLRPGPRIVDALENMTSYLYPNLIE